MGAFGHGGRHGRKGRRASADIRPERRRRATAVRTRPLDARRRGAERADRGRPSALSRGAGPDPPDPPGADPHDAEGRTLYYGLLPATTSDLELSANPDPTKDADPAKAQRLPRFDDLSIYELRCFVRRHDPACRRRPGRRDCCGPLTFSAPSDGYRLANPTDGRGTANRPATVRLPTRKELEADAAATAGLGGMKVASPDIVVDPTPGAQFQICSFGIPLITIVATFVIRLFLPIVTLVLGLWVLLALRMCIPPSIDLSGGAQAELLEMKPDLEVKADFEATWNAAHPDDKLGTALGAHGQALAAALANSGLKADVDLELGTKITDPGQRFRLFRALAAGEFRSPTDDLEFAARVRRAMVPVP